MARASLIEEERGLPRPDGPPQSHSPGRDSVRILVVGNGAALGAGVRRHDLALPGAIARAVSARVGNGVDVDLVADPQLSLGRVVAAVRDAHPDRYAAVVVVSGSDEALESTPLATWRARLAGVLAELRRLLPSSTALVMTGVPADHADRAMLAPFARLADSHAADLDRVSVDVCAAVAGVRFVPLGPARMVSGARRHAADQYAGWGEVIAAAVVKALVHGAQSARGVSPDAATVEWQRQTAVDRLGLAGSPADPRLQRIVDITRRVFGTETAVFTVLDRDVQRNKAGAGIDVAELPRIHSFCHHTILQDGGMIIEDASLDDRFRDNPLVTGAPHLRFYAGFPVDSPDGERVGALCIFDSSPRRADDVDAALLRELAHLVQTELWRYLPDTASAEAGLRLVTQSWTRGRVSLGRAVTSMLPTREGSVATE
jgi:GAF domain-containing protein